MNQHIFYLHYTFIILQFILIAFGDDVDLYTGKALVGIVLEYETFGSHLDDNKNTIDETLEKDNFAAAGEVLSDIWNELVIDGHHVSAKYVDPTTSAFKQRPFKQASEEWYSKHCQQGYYFLSFMKCDEEKCCGEFRSNIRDLFPDRKIPPPRYYVHRNGIVQLGKSHTDPGKNKHYASLPIIKMNESMVKM